MDATIQCRACFMALLVTALTGCGADVASTAATAATIKKQELEQGQKTLEQVQQKLDQAVQQAPARNGAEP